MSAETLMPAERQKEILERIRTSGNRLLGQVVKKGVSAATTSG